ncbi:hypothetical protein DZJ_24590 [Dickeya ananatis]
MATSNKKAQSGGKKRSLWLILLIVIALAATAGAGAGWWFLNHKKNRDGIQRATSAAGTCIHAVGYIHR